MPKAFQIRRSYSSGQVIVLAAGLMVVLVGMLGLAVDLGYSFAQRRAVQNAADAGAIAGATALTRWSTTNTSVSALADVQDLVNRNRMGTTNTYTTTCDYTNDADTAIGPCSGTVPSTATGVRVTVTETHDTFFIQAVPGAPNSVTTSAVSTAHVAKVTGLGSDGPFIVCGSEALVANTNTTMPVIVNNGGNWVPNPNAVNKTFIVHDPQLGQHGGDCGMASQSFKGLADQDYNEGKTAPGWFNGDTGTKAGPARTTVNGTQGCKVGGAEPYNCVMILPIAVDNPAPQKSGNLRLFYVVGYAPFFVSECGKNCHQAKLLGNYSVAPPNNLPAWAPDGWVRGANGVVTVRLTK